MTALKKIGGEKRKLVILAVAVAVGAALTWYVKNYVSLEALVAQEEKVREAIDRRPWRSVRAGPRYLLGRLAGARHFRKVCRIRLDVWILARPRTYNPWPYHRRDGDFQPQPLRFPGLDQAPLWAISRGAGQAPAPRRRLLFVNPAHGTFPVHHRQSRQRRQRGAELKLFVGLRASA